PSRIARGSSRGSSRAARSGVETAAGQASRSGRALRPGRENPQGSRPGPELCRRDGSQPIGASANCAGETFEPAWFAGVHRGDVPGRAQAKISGEEAVKEELRKLQGTWIGVGGAFRGKESSEEESKLAGHRLVISKDKFYWYTALQKEPISQGSFKIDPTKLPKTMDLTWDGDEKRPIGKCIYELNDDVMK